MKKHCLPPTTKRVALNTCSKVNGTIRSETVDCIVRYMGEGEAVLSEKIRKLDREWDTERVLETTASTAVLLGSVMAFRKKTCCWSLFTGTVGAFFLMHALQGWCPSLPLVRSMGVRTAEEIFHEKTVFKMIRGDFCENSADAESLLDIAEK